MIEVTLDFMMLKRKMSSKELAQKIGITPANLSILKTGKAKGIRFETLEKICQVLDCQPGDLLKYKPNMGDVSDKQQILVEILKEFISKVKAHDYREGNEFLLERLDLGLKKAEEDEDPKETAHDVYQHVASICLVNKIDLDEDEEKLLKRLDDIAMDRKL